jgi:hypothetical protein
MKRPGQCAWTGGFRGKRRNGLCPGHQIEDIFIFVFFLWSVFVQGVTAEGRGFTLLWSSGRGLLTGFVCFFPWCELHIPRE